MKIRKLLITSAAGVLATAGIATAPIAANAQNVRVCDQYGDKFFTMPGTRTCLGVSGRVRAHIQTTTTDRTIHTGATSTAASGRTGALATDTVDDTSEFNLNGRVQFDMRNPSDLGTVRSVLRVAGANDGSGSATIDSFRIHLGSFFAMGNWDSFLDRHNGYGHNQGNFDGLVYADSTTGRYFEFSGNAGPITLTGGAEMNEGEPGGTLDGLDYYVGAKFGLGGLGSIAVHAQQFERPEVVALPNATTPVVGVPATSELGWGVAFDFNAIDNLGIRGWFHGDDGGANGYIPGANTTRWGVGGSYSFGAWQVAVGYSVETGADDVVGTAAVAAAQPETSQLSFELDRAIAPGLRAELGFEQVEGAVVPNSDAGANISFKDDETNIRFRLIREW